MVGAWRDYRESPVDLGLGLMDLRAGRETRRAHAAAFAIGDALTRINATTATPQQARQEAAKLARKH